MSRLREFAGTQDLALNLTLRELRGRYKRSVLGWTWSLLNPLATVAIYSLVFGFFILVLNRRSTWSFVVSAVPATSASRWRP